MIKEQATLSQQLKQSSDSPDAAQKAQKIQGITRELENEPCYSKIVDRLVKLVPYP